MDEREAQLAAIDLIVAQAKRVQRESRRLVQSASQLRDSLHDTAQEGTDNGNSPEDS